MGVAGSGKSVIGAAIASALHIDFVEGDDYHTDQNVQRMAAGIPLTDADRAQWLHALALHVREAKRMGKGLVMTCSALKRSYRDILRAEANDLQFIFLRGPRELIAKRLGNRRGHFMPSSLLDSQLAILEEPTPDENAWIFEIAPAPEKIVTDLVARASR